MTRHRGEERAERFPMSFTQSGLVRDHSCVKRSRLCDP
jgi:hypothetical protein